MGRRRSLHTEHWWVFLFYCDEEFANFTRLQNKECAACCSTLFIIDFGHFWQFFHISNTEINFSPSGKVRSLTNMQKAGQPHFTDTAWRRRRCSDQESASPSGPLVLRWLFGTAKEQEENRAKTPDSWWVQRHPDLLKGNEGQRTSSSSIISGVRWTEMDQQILRAPNTSATWMQTRDWGHPRDLRTKQ